LRMIVYSHLDQAGKNIARHLRTIMNFAEASAGESLCAVWKCVDYMMVETAQRLIELDLNMLGAEWLLCLSRHRSESGKRCLTVHTPGNLMPHADLGGKPSAVGIANPGLQTLLLIELKAERDRLGIPDDLTVEATHHGPTDIPCPITFIEIGSDEEAWVNPRLGQCVAQAVARVLAEERRPPPNAIGVGGGHYSEKFTSVMLEGRFSIGHIIPKYAMSGGMGNEMFSKCIERTWGGVSAVVVDWKGTPSPYKEHLKALSASLGIELVRV
jgi:D-aminoacyl-tRNA deacylase